MADRFDNITPSLIIQNGHTVIQNDAGTAWISRKVPVNGADVGLGEVDNTSDADKPISDATQSALDSKQDNLGTGNDSQFLNGEHDWVEIPITDAPAYTGLLVNNNSFDSPPTDVAEYAIPATPMTFAYRDDDGTLTAATPTESGHLTTKAYVDGLVDDSETRSMDEVEALAESLAEVAFSGDYNDLDNRPTIPTDQVNTDWNATTGKAQLLNKPTLGSAATASTSDFATAVQGGKADSAVQPGDLADVATSGSYNDLDNKPTIPAAQVQADWGQSNTGSVDYIKNKPVVPKFAAVSGNVNGGSVTLDVSAAGFTNLTQAGCQFRVNDDDEQYSFEVTALSNTSVTVSVKRRQFTGITVVGIGVLGSTTMATAPNGVTVHLLAVGV